MIVNPRDTTKKYLELINEFSKVEEHKINTQNSVVFLYICNEQPKKEIQKTILFTTASKRVKYLRIDLTKEVKDLPTENYKTFLREIDGKSLLVHRLENLIFLR